MVKRYHEEKKNGKVLKVDKAAAELGEEKNAKIGIIDDKKHVIPDEGVSVDDAYVKAKVRMNANARKKLRSVYDEPKTKRVIDEVTGESVMETRADIEARAFTKKTKEESDFITAAIAIVFVIILLLLVFYLS